VSRRRDSRPHVGTCFHREHLSGCRRVEGPRVSEAGCRGRVGRRRPARRASRRCRWVPRSRRSTREVKGARPPRPAGTFRRTRGFRGARWSPLEPSCPKGGRRRQRVPESSLSGACVLPCLHGLAGAPSHAARRLYPSARAAYRGGGWCSAIDVPVRMAGAAIGASFRISATSPREWCFVNRVEESNTNRGENREPFTKRTLCSTTSESRWQHRLRNDPFTDSGRSHDKDGTRENVR